MKRREMILRSLQAGAVIPFIKPIELLAKEFENSLTSPLTGNQLRFPPVFENGGTMSLSTQNVNVWPGQETEVVSINGSYPGPSVVIEKGSVFTANFVNNHNEPATVHWHGVDAPEIMDGHPKDAVMPGESKTYTFPVVNRGGTYFYHSHAHMLTSEHVYKGFAGFFIVTDPAEAGLGLPTGDFDVPLCIQDRRSANIPQFLYNPGMPEVIHGFMGDVPLINGTPEAFFPVSKTLYRFRLLNGSNARIYKIALSDNTPFYIIGTDGGLKDSAVQANSFFLSPGERTEILVDFSSYNIGQNVILKSLPFTAPGGGSYVQGTELDLLRFDITDNQSSGGIVPASMPPINYYDIEDVKTIRNFTLTMNMGGGVNIHRINGLTFEMNRTDWETPLNSLEEWKLINATNMLHPMHSHSTQFQVHSRNGNTNLPPEDKGWKDTVLVNPFETVIVIAKFTHYKGLYLFHCHNLEHEDDGMMLNFKVVDPVGINEENENAADEFRLDQNYPNPFNPSTKITFHCPVSAYVILKVYDELGNQVATLVNEKKNSGRHEVEFSGNGLASGIYYYKLIASGSSGNFSEVKKMILLK